MYVGKMLKIIRPQENPTVKKTSITQIKRSDKGKPHVGEAIRLVQLRHLYWNISHDSYRPFKSYHVA